VIKVDFGSHCLGLRCYESTGRQENATALQAQIVSQMIWQSAGDQFTVFAILYCFRYLEAFGSIWILTVFAILHRFDIEKTNQRKQLNFQMLPKIISKLVSGTLSYTQGCYS
jgi:hypothetical protein